MNKKYKHVPVTDMTFGQLYDAVANGEEFYDDGKHKISIDDLGFMESCWHEQTKIIKLLYSSEITRRVEIDWREQLDGTWENGVWCKVWDAANRRSTIAKVLSYNSDIAFRYTDNNCNWQPAEPFSKELAELLEKEFSRGQNEPT